MINSFNKLWCTARIFCNVKFLQSCKMSHHVDINRKQKCQSYSSMTIQSTKNTYHQHSSNLISMTLFGNRAHWREAILFIDDIHALFSFQITFTGLHICHPTLTTIVTLFTTKSTEVFFSDKHQILTNYVIQFLPNTKDSLARKPASLSSENQPHHLSKHSYACLIINSEIRKTSELHRRSPLLSNFVAFLPRDAMRNRGLCCRLVSVCLSSWCTVSIWLKI